MKILNFLAAAALLAVSAVSLAAQDYRTFADEYAEIRDRKLLRVGALRIVPAFRFSNIGYDSNVFYRAREGQPISDYTATISPEIRGYVLVGHSLILSVAENPEYLFYLHEKGLRSFTNSVAPAFRLLLLNSLAISGEYHFQEHTRRAFSEFEMPIVDTQKGYSGSVFLETSRGTAIGVSGTLDDFLYRDPEAGGLPSFYALTLDRRERSLGLDVYYPVFTQSRIFAGVAYEDYIFSHVESSWRNARAYRALAGMRFPLTGRARGTVSLGFKRFVPDAEGRKAFSGLVADTDVVFRFGRLGLNLGYVRDNYFSYYETAYYYVEDRFRGSVSLYVLPFLRLDAGWLAGAWNYPEPQEVWAGDGFIVLDHRRDVNRILSAGLAVRLTGRTGLGVSYNFYRRRSNAPGFDIDRNFLGAYVTYDF